MDKYINLRITRVLIRGSFFLLVIIPFLYIIPHNIIQSFTDFFIVGSKNGLQSFYIWNETNFGSNNAGELWRLFPLSLIYYTTNNILHIPHGVTQFIIFTILYLTAYKSFIKLCNKLFDNNNNSEWPIYIAGLFFIFNPYTLSQISNSFLLVIPYLVLPLQLLLFIKAVESKTYAKYVILLALLNASVYGINLIFDVISLIALLLIGLWGVYVSKTFRANKTAIIYISSILITVGLITFWILPQIYGSLSDADTTAYVLNSENFYNLDSSISNVLRGLGEWSFFGSNNNVPYLSYSVSYKSNVLVLFAGYLLPLIALLPLAIREKRHVNNWPIFFYLLLFLVIPFIGGTHDGWLTTGLMKWLFANVPYFLAFRNTYKFASLEMLSLAVLIAYSLLLSSKSRIEKNFKIIGGVIVVALILINAFPYFKGQLFSKSQTIDSIPSYWIESADYINAKSDLFTNIFTLPDQYFEVFNWQDGQKNFPRNLEDTLYNKNVVHNICRGCGSPRNANILSYAYKNTNDPKIFPFLGLLGVSHVLQRNDYAYKYYNVESPDRIKKSLAASNILSSEKSFGKLDLYKVDSLNVYSRLYSPSNIVETSKVSEAVDALNTTLKSKDSTSIVLSSQIKNSELTKRNSNYFKHLFDRDETILGSKVASNKFSTNNSGTATISTANVDGNDSLNYKISYAYVDNSFHLYLLPQKNIISIDNKPVLNSDGGVSDKIDINLGLYNNNIAVKLAKQAYLLRQDSQGTLGTIKLASGSTTASVYSIIQEKLINQVSNGSLEMGSWQKDVTDCQKNDSNAQISMNLIKGGTDGLAALQLSAKQDTACTYTPNLSSFKSGVYLYSFDYKNVKGSNPSYCAWDGRGCVQYSDIDSSKSWKNFTNAAYLDDNASNFNLYLYAQKGNFPQTINQYDNVKIYRLNNLDKSVTVTTQVYKSDLADLTLSKGLHEAEVRIDSDPTELLNNGSFEDGLWADKVANCSQSGPSNSIRMNRTTDGFTGKYSLELVSTGDTACTSSDIVKSFNRADIYSVTLSYRVLKGENARICVWDGIKCIIDKTLSPRDTKWHTYRAVAKPLSSSRILNIYLYAQKGKINSQVHYDGLRVNKINNNFLDTYVLKTKISKNITAGKVYSVTKYDPTNYSLRYKTNGLTTLVFQQSYNPNWKAYILPIKSSPTAISYKFGVGDRFSIPNENHYIANGLMNGWWIDKATIPAKYVRADDTVNIQIVYSSQRFVYIGLLISGSVMTACIYYLIYDCNKRTKINTKSYKI